MVKEIKERRLVCLPSDKGGEFCVVDERRYIEAGMEHLNDSSTYRTIPHLQAKTIETKINKVWRNVCESCEISLRIRKSFITTNSAIPRFYHLIKTHKVSPSLKIRPIVSNVNGPTHKISWLLSRILKPLLNTVPAHLESSEELINQLKILEPEFVKQHPYPFSLDVVALYTSIPIQDAIFSPTPLT
jgi:hypothetical protein